MPKHFLHISDYDTDDLWEILSLAKELKIKFHKKETYKPFQDRSLAMIFAKPSFLILQGCKQPQPLSVASPHLFTLLAN